VLFRVYTREWHKDIPVALLPIYIRFIAAYEGLESYRVVQVVDNEVRVVNPREVEPKGEIYIATPDDVVIAEFSIRNMLYVDVPPEGEVLKAWRAFVTTAPLLWPTTRTVKLLSVEGTLVGKSPIPDGTYEVDAAITVLNKVPRGSGISRRRTGQEPVKCPKCGKEGRVVVGFAVVHESMNKRKVCYVHNRKANEAATAVIESFLAT